MLHCRFHVLNKSSQLNLNIIYYFCSRLMCEPHANLDFTQSSILNDFTEIVSNIILNHRTIKEKSRNLPGLGKMANTINSFLFLSQMPSDGCLQGTLWHKCLPTNTHVTLHVCDRYIIIALWSSPCCFVAQNNIKQGAA